MYEENSLDDPDHNQRGTRGGPRKAGYGENGASHNQKHIGFKNRLFRVYYWMQRDRNTSQIVAFLLIIINFA